ncbi:hypothetical protein FBU30_010707 [Linnemannia zychae]|nr:hypothetical protein FBU30_010707 [Linnemannia zychae]
MEKALALPPDWFNINHKIVIAGNQLTMAFCNLLLQTHWGSAKQAGSLQFNKLLLKRKHVRLTDFDFRATDERRGEVKEEGK